MSARPSVQTCIKCEAVFSSEKARCPTCKAWQPPKNLILSSNDNRVDDCVRLDSIPDTDVDRIPTGEWDQCFGGSQPPYGIALTSTILLGGEPGAGKSTLSLQILNGIARFTGRDVLVVGAEESAKEVMARSSRLLLTHRNLMQLLPMGTNSDIAEVIIRRKPAGILLDSLPGFINDPGEALELASALKGYAVLIGCPIILVDHVNKDKDFAGFMALQHKVDTTIQLTTDESDLRTLFTIKNRYGPGHVELFMEMTEQGLVVIDEPEDEDDD